MKKLLILGTSNSSREIVRTAKEMGIYTIVTDYLSPDRSLAKTISDEYWMISTNDLDLLEKKCREENISGVIAGASDFNAEMAILLNERLGLNTYCSSATWHYSRDKQDFKKVCVELNAPVATDYVVTEEFLKEDLEKIVYPVVVKPVDLSGNRGISYCYNESELIAAYRYAQSVSKSDKIIIERMLEGEEWFVTYALADGEVHLVAMNAMHSEKGCPKNCYSITTTMTDHVEHFNKDINDKIIEVIKHIGGREGICWVQVMLDKDGHFYIIEMGYRLDGCMIFIPYKNVFGFDVIKWLIQFAIGERHSKNELPAAMTHAYTKCGCDYMFWTKKEGSVKEIIGLDEIAKEENVMIEVFTKVGDSFGKNKSCGNILFATNDCDEMCRIIEKINNKVKFVDQNGENLFITFTDFDRLLEIYHNGLEGK